MNIKKLVALLIFLNIAAGAEEIDGWRVIEGEWKGNPLSGEGTLEYTKTVQGKIEISTLVSYDLKTEDLFGLGLLPQDGSLIKIFVQGTSQLSIQMKSKEGETKTLAATKIVRTTKRPTLFRCILKGRDVAVMLGAAKLKAQLPTDLDGAKVRLVSVGQKLSFEDFRIKE